MNLVIEPRDLKIFKRIAMESRKREAVALTKTTSSHHSSERSSPWSVETSNWPVLEEKIQVPQAATAKVPRRIFKTTPKSIEASAPKLLGGPDDLSDNDIVFLFSKYKELTDIERQDLKCYMEILKSEDDERFELILSLTKGCGEWLKSQITGKSG